MKLIASFVLIVLIANGYCDTTTDITTNTQTDTSTTETTVTPTTKPSDTTTTSLDTTTSPTTTSSTAQSTTTETSTSETTTASLPDTTTSPPSPTTLPPASTTKSPEPPTAVDSSWNVTEENVTCIRADLKVRFKIPLEDRTEYIVIYPNATSSGNCNFTKTAQELQIEDSEYTLKMIFEKDSNNAYLKNVTFSYTLPDGSDVVSNDTKLFSVKIGNSYMCDSSSNIILKNVTMEIFHIRIQSFGKPEDKDFGTAEECEADNKVNDMVPIAVGIALLVLVVIVLIAYFVGRRRSRQKGYQSV